MLKNVLTKHDINHYVFTSDNSKIKQVFASFKRGDIQVLLLNTENYATGFNIECITDVIIYHKLSSTVEKQVIGRVQRHPRNKSLNVYYLTHENETNNNDTIVNLLAYKDSEELRKSI